MNEIADIDSERENRAEHIGRAAAALLSRGRSSDVTVRAVAERAGVSAAMVQRDYPSRNLLLEAAYARALDAERAHAATVATVPHPEPDDDNQRAAILDMRLTARLRAGVDAARARLAVLLAQARGAGAAEAASAWFHAVLEDHADLGLDPEGTRMLSELLIGLELLSLGCRDHPLLPAINREVLAHGVLIARGKWRAALPPWFSAATHDLMNRHRAAEEARARADNGRKRRGRGLMLESAQQIVVEHGFGALSHRSVATRSGAALSHVSKEFPTTPQLLHALYHGIHAELFRQTIASGETGWEATAAILANGAQTHLLSIEANLFASAETELGDAAWDMRVGRGAVILRKGPGPAELAPGDFDSHFISIWGAGALLLLPTVTPPAEIEQGFRRRMAILRERLPGLTAD